MFKKKEKIMSEDVKKSIKGKLELMVKQDFVISIMEGENFKKKFDETVKALLKNSNIEKSQNVGNAQSIILTKLMLLEFITDVNPIVLTKEVYNEILKINEEIKDDINLLMEKFYK